MNYRAQVFDIRSRLLIGALTYDEAKKEADPIIDEMNRVGKVIAANHKKHFTPFTFTSLMR